MFESLHEALSVIAAIAGLMAVLFSYLAWRASVAVKVTELERTLNTQFSYFFNTLGGWKATRSYIVTLSNGNQYNVDVFASLVPPIFLIETKNWKYRLRKALWQSKVSGTMTFNIDVMISHKLPENYLLPDILAKKPGHAIENVIRTIGKKSIEIKMNITFYKRKHKDYLRVSIEAPFEASSASELADYIIKLLEGFMDTLSDIFRYSVYRKCKNCYIKQVFPPQS
ncbi:hypothetical protein J4526_01475 [Desulfurococcaceae archaeon MEX13E-LK6-19]|nr:hypothetical protein J4526_01475 [Desulfurococcaceae archaeon MEX13E-LK6-19]